MKQLHTLPDGKIVLISSYSKHPELAYQIPTLEQDRSTWLEISERCGGKLQQGLHYKLEDHGVNVGYDYSSRLTAIPVPQTEDLWEEMLNNYHKIANHVDSIINLKEHYNLTRKS